jgi:sortase A
LRADRTWHLLERAFAVVAAVALGYCLLTIGEAWVFQAVESAQFDRMRMAATVPQAEARDHAAPNAVVARLEVPRLGVSALVRVGVDARTLRVAIGHIPGTAPPGAAGNVGFAGHRDTFLRRLDGIRMEDEIVLVTTSETLIYRVERTMIVKPSDVWVLDPSDNPVLTLVTCHPFTFSGAAPERFVVRATLEERRLSRAGARSG